MFLTGKLQVAVDLFDDPIIPAEAEYLVVRHPVQPFGQGGPGLTGLIFLECRNYGDAKWAFSSQGAAESIEPAGVLAQHERLLSFG